MAQRSHLYIAAYIGFHQGKGGPKLVCVGRPGMPLREGPELDSFACQHRDSPTTGRTCLQTSRNPCVWMNPSGPFTPARWVEAAANADVIVFRLGQPEHVKYTV